MTLRYTFNTAMATFRGMSRVSFNTFIVGGSAGSGEFCNLTSHFGIEFLKACVFCSGERTEDDVCTGESFTDEFITDGLHAASYSVSHHRIADGFRDDVPETSGSFCGHKNRVGDGDSTSHAASAANRVAVIRARGDAMGLCHNCSRYAKTYALSLVRRFARRAERIARPARVRMRRRKPCFLARRRLFGWNVRLLIITPCVSTRNFPECQCVVQGIQKDLRG